MEQAHGVGGDERRVATGSKERDRYGIRCIPTSHANCHRARIRLIAGAVQRNWVLSAGSGGWTSNGRLFDMNRIDAQVRLGATEIWAFQNQRRMLHPMHLHDVQFQVLSRSGGAIPANERGWKDTVVVNPMATVRVIARFTDYADRYLLHCHILEHEGMGMLAQFNVA